MCACVSEGVSVLVSKLEMHHCGIGNLRTTNEVETLILGSVSDSCVVE